MEEVVWPESVGLEWLLWRNRSVWRPILCYNMTRTDRLEFFDMSHLDKIIDFLSYHPGLSRPDIMAQLNLGVGETQVKMALADGLARGDLRVEGKARATRYFVTAKGRLLKTVNLDTYYSLPLGQREMRTSYNFALIRDELPSIDVFTREEYAFLDERERVFSERCKDYPRELYRKEMERLGIDLSWKSSEIEGNTYSLLETVNWKSRRRFARRSTICAVSSTARRIRTRRLC